MVMIHKVVKKIKFFWNFLIISSLKGKNKFSYIYNNSYWKNQTNGSRSGSGSNVSSTKNIILELNKLIKEKNIKSILDIPCGDWNWMQKLNLKNVSYLGGDIVDEIIKENNIKFSSDRIKFESIDIIFDKLPDSDLIIIRDLLVHLKDNEIFDFFKNIKKSNFKYIAITSFDHILQNTKGTIDDNWRPLNLTIAPFYLRQPEIKLDDSCNGTFNEKFKKLYVWENSLD